MSPAAGGLRVQATGQPALFASAAGTDQFVVPEVGAMLVFQHNPQGEVESLTLHQGGREMPGRRRAE